MTDPNPADGAPDDEAPGEAEPTEPTAVVVAQKPTKPKKPQRSFLKELPFLVAIALVLALLIKTFLVQAFYIPSGSMQQTLAIGDRVLVNKVPYHYRGPHRGEIVVFNGVDSFDEGITIAKPSNPISRALQKFSGAIGLGAPSERDYIKRVIGLPGDRVMCCDDAGNVVVTPPDGKSFSLHETYLFEDDHERFCAASQGSTGPVTSTLCPVGAAGVLIPKGRLWVMGDHRGNSADSRAHGTIPENKVVGRAFTVVYPLGHVGLLHVPKTFADVALPASPVGLGLAGALPLTLVRRKRLRRRPR